MMKSSKEGSKLTVISPRKQKSLYQKSFIYKSDNSIPSAFSEQPTLGVPEELTRLVKYKARGSPTGPSIWPLIKEFIF